MHIFSDCLLKCDIFGVEKDSLLQTVSMMHKRQKIDAEYICSSILQDYKFFGIFKGCLFMM